jgi:hypothetical protein
MAESPILSCCVAPEIKAEVERIAAERGWSKSFTTARLLAKALRDIDQQVRDGFTEVKI